MSDREDAPIGARKAPRYVGHADRDYAAGEPVGYHDADGHYGITMVPAAEIIPYLAPITIGPDRKVRVLRAVETESSTTTGGDAPAEPEAKPESWRDRPPLL